MADSNEKSNVMSRLKMPEGKSGSSGGGVSGFGQAAPKSRSMRLTDTDHDILDRQASAMGRMKTRGRASDDVNAEHARYETMRDTAHDKAITSTFKSNPEAAQKILKDFELTPDQLRKFMKTHDHLPESPEEWNRLYDHVQEVSESNF